MAAHRAQWKGHIKVGDVSMAVGLYTAASTAERVTFHTINEATGNRLHREFVDSETEETVDRDCQVKGFELDNGEYVMIDPEEVAAVIPDSDKMLDIEAFFPVTDVDDIYLDKPYYVVPSDDESDDFFTALREALEQEGLVAIARTVLFRRMRTVLVRAHGRGLIANTLNFDYEVRSAKEAFKDIPKIKLDKEMIDLAQHIIGTKKGEFDPAGFDDRYETALSTLVEAKASGKALPKPKPVKVSKPGDLLQALRDSAGVAGSMPQAKKVKAANHNDIPAKHNASPKTSKRKSN